MLAHNSIPESSYLTDVSELRPPYMQTSAFIKAKQINHIDPHCRTFIGYSPMVMVSSYHPERGADVSPRGDAPGFVQVLDERHLAIPDRLGNNRLDTLENLLANPAIGLLFLIPGVEELLRVNGLARLTSAQALLDTMVIEGRPPKLAILVEVREAYMHCAKALKRGRLWEPDYRIERSRLPSLGRMIVEQARPAGITAEQADARIKADYQANLY